MVLRLRFKHFFYCFFFFAAHGGLRPAPPMRACTRAPIKHLIFYLVNLSRARAHKTPYILPCKFFSRMRTYICTHNVKHGAHKCARIAHTT